jgi:hypothetical protein
LCLAGLFLVHIADAALAKEELWTAIGGTEAETVSIIISDMTVELLTAGEDNDNRGAGIDQRLQVGGFLTSTLSARGLA